MHKLKNKYLGIWENLYKLWRSLFNFFLEVFMEKIVKTNPNFITCQSVPPSTEAAKLVKL